MITLFAPGAEDLSTNGLRILDPLILAGTAVIHGELNGDETLEMDLLPSARILPEMLIKAPAPARDTPAIDAGGGTGAEIWRVTGGHVYMRTGPGTRYKAIKVYKLGTEMLLISKTSASWYKLTAPDGTTGYMSTYYLAYVRTDTSPGETIEPHKAKEQVYRVREVVQALDHVHVRAVHWSYDLARNYVARAAVKGLTGAAAIQAVAAATAYEHDFMFYSDVGGAVEADLEKTNPIEALLGDGGLVEQLGGEVLRDNLDIYWTEHIGEDRGVTIAYGKNMTGLELDVITDDVATRIIPVGYDASGNEIYLDETYVDSPLIDDYPAPCIRRMEYRDVKVGEDYASAAAVKAELRRRAAAEYSANDLDKAVVTLKTQYADMKNTSLGERFAHYTNVYMGDTVRVQHAEYGFEIAAEMTAYDWDPLLEEYIEATFTNRPERLSEIWSWA